MRLIERRGNTKPVRALFRDDEGNDEVADDAEDAEDGDAGGEKDASKSVLPVADEPGCTGHEDEGEKRDSNEIAPSVDEKTCEDGEKGERAVEFFFHEDVLTRQSGFAKAALKSCLREPDERNIRPSHNVEAFEVFADFMYTGKIISTRDGDEYEDEDEGEYIISGSDAGGESSSDASEGSGSELSSYSTLRTDWEWDRLPRCWTLGDKLQSQSFKDATVDAMVENVKMEGRHPVDVHRSAYNTLGENAFKRFTVNVAVFSWGRRQLFLANYERSTV